MALVLALGVVVAGEAVQLGVEILKGAGRVGAQPGGCRLAGALDLALGLRVAHPPADGTHPQGCQPLLGGSRASDTAGVERQCVVRQDRRRAPPGGEGLLKDRAGACHALTAPAGPQGGDDPRAVVNDLVDGHQTVLQAPLEAVDLPQLVGRAAGEALVRRPGPLARGGDHQAGSA